MQDIFATKGPESGPIRSPPHIVAASYFALKRLQSPDDR